MAKGQKSGGRKAGTPNKRTLDASAATRTTWCDAIEGMAASCQLVVPVPAVQPRNGLPTRLCIARASVCRVKGPLTD